MGECEAVSSRERGHKRSIGVVDDQVATNRRRTGCGADCPRGTDDGVLHITASFFPSSCRSQAGGQREVVL